MNLTANSPFVLRLWGYLQQRFPFQNGILFLILFISAQVFSNFLNQQNSYSFGWVELLGFIAVYFFFFVLRVFDEHKDYEIDCLNHPERILQQGLITLQHLKIIAIVGVLFQAIYCIWLAPSGLYFWLIAFCFSVFMAKDFFIESFLHKHLFIMMFTHAPVTPLVIIWMMTMSDSLGFSMLAICFILTCLCCGIAFEISRKIKCPEDEVKTVDSYSQVVGYKAASIYAFSALFVSTLLLTYMLYAIISLSIFLCIPILLLMLSAYVFWQFTKKPTRKKAKTLEVTASVYMLLMYLILLTALLTKMEWVWNF